MSVISVIVPVYKVEKYIRRCVESILAQTYENFELILVDDGSPDDCGTICDEYAAKDSRIHVIHQENGGLSAARNAGIDWVLANSGSQWITFVDSDDWIHPAMLEVLLGMAEEHGTNISVCGHIETPEYEIHAQPKETKRVKWTAEDYFMSGGIYVSIAWAKLYHRKCFDTIRYPVGKIHEDEFTTYKVIFSEEYVSETDMPLYYYFCNPEGITGKWTPKRFDCLEAIEAQADYFKKKGLWKPYVRSACFYVELLQIHRDHLNRSTLSDHKKQYYHRFLRKCLRRMIRKHGKAYIKERAFSVFLEAYPCLRSVAWIKRMFKRRSA